MNKCESCKHYREYNDNKFSPLPLCTRRYSDLGNASDDFEKRNSECGFYEVKKFISVVETIKSACKGFEKTSESVEMFNETMCGLREVLEDEK